MGHSDLGPQHVHVILLHVVTLLNGYSNSIGEFTVKSIFSQPDGMQFKLKHQERPCTLPMKYAPRVKRGLPSAGGSALASPTFRKDLGTPCTNCVVCRGSGCTASLSLTICTGRKCTNFVASG